jgi:hypothetical protein
VARDIALAELRAGGRGSGRASDIPGAEREEEALGPNLDAHYLDAHSLKLWNRKLRASVTNS